MIYVGPIGDAHDPETKNTAEVDLTPGKPSAICLPLTLFYWGKTTVIKAKKDIYAQCLFLTQGPEEGEGR